MESDLDKVNLKRIQVKVKRNLTISPN